MQQLFISQFFGAKGIIILNYVDDFGLNGITIRMGNGTDLF